MTDPYTMPPINERLGRQAVTIADLQAQVRDLTRDRARWQRAHAIVESERDQARRERDQTAHERTEAVNRLAACMSDYQDIEDEYIEYKTRAEKTEAASVNTTGSLTRADLNKAIRTAPIVRRFVDHSELVEVGHAVDALCELLEIDPEPDPGPVSRLAGQMAQILAADDTIGGSWSMDPADWREICLTLAQRAHDALAAPAQEPPQT